VTDKQLDTGDLDALVLRALSGLPTFGPGRGFADRVMARVRRPRPAAVVLLSRAGAWALQPSRAVSLAAAYAVCVAVGLRLAVPWLTAHAPAISFISSWVVGRASALLDASAMTVAGWAVQVGAADAIHTAATAGPRLWAALAALTLGYAACGYGLRVLLRTPRRKDVSLAGAL
jgi:hypothetical protein